MRKSLTTILLLLLLPIGLFAQEWRIAFDKQQTPILEKALTSDKAFADALKNNLRIIKADDDLSFLMKDTQVLLVGEYHGEHLFTRETNLLIKNLASKKQLTHYATEFLTADEQPAIDAFNSETSNMDAFRKSVSVEAGADTLLVANRYKLKTIGLEENRARWDFEWAGSEEGVSFRNMQWAKLVNNVFKDNQSAKMLLYCGASHSNYKTAQSTTLPQYLKTHNLKFKVVRFVRRNIPDMPWVDFLKSQNMRDKYVLISIPSQYRDIANADYIYYIPFDNKERSSELKEKEESLFNALRDGQPKKLPKYCLTDPDHPLCKMNNDFDKDKPK